MSDAWTIEIYEAENGKVPFESFVDDLSDLKALALATAVDRVLRKRGANFGIGLGNGSGISEVDVIW